MTTELRATNRRTPPTGQTVLRRKVSPSVEYVEIDGEAVVYDCERNAVHLLDPIGTLLWLFLDGRSPLDEIARDLSAGFGRDPDELIVDLLRFADHLMDLELAEEQR